jgi:hypothetical protein
MPRILTNQSPCSKALALLDNSSRARVKPLRSFEKYAICMICSPIQNGCYAPNFMLYGTSTFIPVVPLLHTAWHEIVIQKFIRSEALALSIKIYR